MGDRPIYYILVSLYHVVDGRLVDRLCKQIRTVSIHFGFNYLSEDIGHSKFSLHSSKRFLTVTELVQVLCYS
jgi:hypothetical protein